MQNFYVFIFDCVLGFFFSFIFLPSASGRKWANFKQNICLTDMGDCTKSSVWQSKYAKDLQWWRNDGHTKDRNTSHSLYTPSNKITWPQMWSWSVKMTSMVNQGPVCRQRIFFDASCARWEVEVYFFWGNKGKSHSHCVCVCVEVFSKELSYLRIFPHTHSPIHTCKVTGH